MSIIRKRWQAARASVLVACINRTNNRRLRMLAAQLLFPQLLFPRTPAAFIRHAFDRMVGRVDCNARICIERGAEGDMNVCEENYYPHCKPAVCSSGCECHATRGKDRSRNRARRA